jgi:hypothetical protein
MEREISRGCRKGPCCGPGLWNIQYNSLLNINIAKQTTAIAVTDDLTIVTRGKTVDEAENVTNTKLSKITVWAKNYKMEFNHDKSTAMLAFRRKRRGRKETNVYLNYKLLKQVNKIKYLGIIMDSKLKFREHITYTGEKCINTLRRVKQKCVIAIPCVVDRSRISAFSSTTSFTSVCQLAWLNFRFKVIDSLIEDVWVSSYR